MVILDTCAVIELFKNEPTFTKKTMALIEAGSEILSISFAEIACKVRLGKLEMSKPTRECLRLISTIDNINIVDITAADWLDSVELIWDENRDPADRLITAYAIKHELAVVSSDKKMKRFYPKVIW